MTHASSPDRPADETISPDRFWEERYAGDAPVWSGRVNATFAEVIDGLAVGRALDLGCGEGGDALWLAQRGWQVTGIDIAPSAVARATALLRDAGLAERGRFVVADLDDLVARGSVAEMLGGEVDLVSASFLHSPVALARTQILRSAAALVAPGGHLFVLSHAAPAPWANEHEHAAHRFTSPAEDIAELGLDERVWTTVIAETRTRPAPGPDGQESHLLDGVVLLRRATT